MERNPAGRLDVERLLSVTQAISQQLTTTSDLAHLLSSVAGAVHSQLLYEYAAIYLADPAGGNLTLCAVAGKDLSQIPLSAYYLQPGEGTPGQAVLRGQFSRVDDFAASPDRTPALGQAEACELSVPIRQGHRSIGALTVAGGRPAQFGPADEQGLAVLADQLAAGIHSVELAQREAERAARERIMTQISQAVNSSLSLDEVLQQAVAAIGERLHVDRCTLGRVDLKAGLLVVEHEYLNPLLTERRMLKGRRPLVGPAELLARLQQAGEVLISTEDRVHPLLGDEWAALAHRYGARSVVWLPISCLEPDSYYRLTLMQLTYPRRWSGEDVALLRAIADQLGLALRNAQLYGAMQRAAADLGAANAEMEAFVYTVSHDLQAPVVSIRGFAALLQTRHAAQLEEHGRAYVDRILANTDFLSRLLQDLLEFSRVGRLEEPDETVPVANVVEQALGDFANALAERQVRLVLPTTWPEVRYSRARLRQVFSNLLSNAVKFLGAQTDPAIEIGWQTTAGQYEFFVRDNGIGIHPDYHQRVFLPFQRLKELEVEGTGIGLSIVKRIVESRGGAIRLQSTPLAGATFTFTIPGAFEAAPEEEADGDGAFEPVADFTSKISQVFRAGHRPQAANSAPVSREGS